MSRFLGYQEPVSFETQDDAPGIRGREFHTNRVAKNPIQDYSLKGLFSHVQSRATIFKEKEKLSSGTDYVNPRPSAIQICSVFVPKRQG